MIFIESVLESYYFQNLRILGMHFFKDMNGSDKLWLGTRMSASHQISYFQSDKIYTLE